MRRIRKVLGPKVLVFCSLDIHAHATELILKKANAFVAYSNYPHVDMDEIGVRVAELLKLFLVVEIVSPWHGNRFLFNAIARDNLLK